MSEVSKGFNSLYQIQEKACERNDSTSKSSLILPSNFDANVSANNLKRELLGKYIVSDETQDILIGSSITKPIKKAKVAKVSWNIQDESTELNPKEKVSTPSRLIPQVNDVFIVKPTPSILPPKPALLQVHRPHSEPSSDLVKSIKDLLSISSQMVPPLVRFDVSNDAADHNFKLFQEANYNLDSILNIKDSPSVTSYGSEFKQVDQLEKLLIHHPRWLTLKKILLKGSDWKLHHIDEKERRGDLFGSLKRGNHKSANVHTKFLSAAIRKEILKGWELLLPIEKAPCIPGLILSPMGVAEQLGVSETGEFVPKQRVTHDLSFPGIKSGHSVNSRVIDESLEPCMFGHAFLHIIHKIVQLRQTYPNKRIWIRKEDAKSAYRRMHVSAATALKAGVQLKIDGITFLLLSLRLPFGGSPCPAEFCLLSDIITDVINDLMACKDWDPRSVHSDYVTKIPASKSLPTLIPFAPAKEMSVQLPDDEDCKSDVFIDDIITVGVDINDNLQRITAAPCTVMHAIAHKATNDETFVPRQNLIADDKNEAEGAPEEVKIVLGWEIDSRRLLVRLPYHKFKAWSSQVQTFITRKSTNLDDLRSVIGRMENVACMVPMFAHFLNNMRQLEMKAELSNKNQLINKRTKDDFRLAIKFLERARTGINMNLITFRCPSKIYINDASEHGLGGFATHGRAWSYIIPDHLQGRAHINLLEFLAQLISIWIDFIEQRIQPLDCLLGMGDNTASMGWMRRSNFRENDEHDTEWLAKQRVARKLANIVLDSEAALYRQWFKGADNDVADSLSRDAYFLSNRSHELFLRKTAPSQVPKHFNIRPVPKEICLFITSTLQLLPVQQHRFKARKPSELAHSNTGLLSSLASELSKYTSTVLPSTSKILSCLPLPKPCEGQLSLQQIEMNWWRERSTPPSHLWHRPSGQSTGQTRDWTLMEGCASSSRNSSGLTATRMDPDESKKHFL